MIPRRKIAAEFNEAGALPERLNLAAFVDEYTFQTKDGRFGRLLSFEGKDPEPLTPQEADDYQRVVRTAIRAIGEGYSVYTYFVKRSEVELLGTEYDDLVLRAAARLRREHLGKKRKHLYSIRCYVVIIRTKSTPTNTQSWKRRIRWQRLSRLVRAFLLSAEIANLEQELADALRELDETVNRFIEQTAEVVDSKILDRKAIFQFLRSLLNPDRDVAEAVSLKHDVFLDQFVCDSPIECHKDHLLVGNSVVRILTLKEPPGETYANVLGRIQRIPANLVITTEWHLRDPLVVRRKMRAAEIHHHNTKISFTHYMGSGRPAAHEVLSDQTKEALVDEIGGARKRFDNDGLGFMECSLSITVTGETLEEVNRAISEIEKEFGRHDAVVHRESYNLLNAYLATIPGGYSDNLRRLWLSSENVTDLFPQFIPARGQPRDKHLNAEAAFVFETVDQILFYYSLFYGDLGHTLMVGQPGAGKTFLLQNLVVAFQKYRPFTLILDLSGGYEGVVKLFGGSHIKIGVGKLSFKIAPFSLPPTRENLQFLSVFVKALIESDGGPKMTPIEDRDLYEEIENVFVLDPDRRRLETVAIGTMASISARLQPWISGGRYAEWFDNVTDTFTVSQFQSIDLEGMERYPQILEPLLLYILYRANEMVYDPAHRDRLKVAIIDEAWKFFINPVVRRYVIEALKTWRKKNGAVFLATQSTEDLRETEMLRHVAETCPTKWFLANPRLDERTYREVFGLNEVEIGLVRNLAPKSESFLKRPNEAKVLRLDVDRRSYWLFTSNPYEVTRRSQLIEQLGLEGALDVLENE